MSEWNRRRFVQSVGLGSAALFLDSSLALSQSKTQPYKGQTLRIFVYSGAWEKSFREVFVPKFEALTGAKVVLDPGWWDSIPKLKASPKGKPAFDLVLTDATQGYPAIKEGMFGKLDLSAIPNSKKLASSSLDHWIYKDGYGITFPESVMTLGYNSKTLGFTPKSWADLLHKDASVTLYNSFYMSLYTYACMKVASEGKPGTAHELCNSNLDAVMAFAKDHRDKVKVWWPTSTDMVLNLVQRNASIGNTHSPDIFSVLKQKPEIKALVPSEDRAFVQMMWVVPADTPRKELAEVAIDFIMSEEIQYEFAIRGSSTSNSAAAKRAGEKDDVWKMMYPSSEAELSKVAYYPYDAYMKDWDKISATWDREILRKKKA